MDNDVAPNTNAESPCAKCTRMAHVCRCDGRPLCIVCVASELEDCRQRSVCLQANVLRLEQALVSARAEAVMLRRLLAHAEHLQTEDLFTIEEIERACAAHGYVADDGQPVALWLASVLEGR